jgi:hypothetical protein
MGDAPGSLGAAIADELDPEGEGAVPMTGLPDAHQLELLREDDGRLDASRVQRAGPGRPKGARNKASVALAKLVTQQFGDPILALASIYARPADQLVAYLGCTRKEAMDLQIRAAAEVAPYVHGKQPVAVDLSIRPAAQVFVENFGEIANDGAGPEGEGGEGTGGLEFAGSAREIENAEYQELSEGEQ